MKTGEETLKNYKEFPNQIAGHSKIKGVTCMVANSDGHLLKYVEDSDVGRTEETFYATIFSNPHFKHLQKFLPRYYGKRTYGKVPGVVKGCLVTYLKLENAVHGFSNPNIVDIKIGKVTFDPFASEEKMQKELLKYPAQNDIGFRLSGMKVYDPYTNIYHGYSARSFRSCTCYRSAEAKTINCLKQFFGMPQSGRYNAKYKTCNIRRKCVMKHLIDCVITQLEGILLCMESQTQVKFYASSILIGYDSGKLHMHGTCTNHRLDSIILTPMDTIDHVCSQQNDGKKEWRLGCKEKQINAREYEKYLSSFDTVPVPYTVKMIDFGHAYINFTETDDLDVDHNYLFGLKNLIKYLERILKNI